jgi:membrane protein DedA with SNARE-associated domain
MNLGPLADMSATWPYWGILVAAIVEGEITYIAAAALVAQGRLNAFGVVVAGAIGATIGDQLFFYVFRGRLPRWMARFPSLERKTRPLLDLVRRHAALMVLMIRFAPGLRIGIAAACASANISPLRFSVLNLVSAFAWATGLMILVGWLGPAYLAQYGLAGWKGAALIGLVVLVLFKVLGALEARAIARAQAR